MSFCKHQHELVYILPLRDHLICTAHTYRCGHCISNHSKNLGSKPVRVFWVHLAIYPSWVSKMSARNSSGLVAESKLPWCCLLLKKMNLWNSSIKICSRSKLILQYVPVMTSVLFCMLVVRLIALNQSLPLRNLLRFIYKNM